MQIGTDWFRHLGAIRSIAGSWGSCVTAVVVTAVVVVVVVTLCESYARSVLTFVQTFLTFFTEIA